MSNPEIYSWQAYLAAVLETDNDLMPLRIYEALAAIEQRLLSPMEAIEQRTIDDAHNRAADAEGRTNRRRHPRYS